MAHGKLDPVEGGFRAKTLNRIIAYINHNRVLPIRPGWEHTPDGIVPPPYTEGGGSSSLGPWSLTYSAEDEGYRLIPGKVFYSYGDRDLEIERDNITGIDDPITVESDTKIWLEVTDFNEEVPTAELKFGEAWEDHPKTFTLTDTEDYLKEVETAYFLLWEFSEDALPDFTYGQRFIDGDGEFWGRRIKTSPEYVIVWGSRNEDTEYGKLVVPVMVPM